MLKAVLLLACVASTIVLVKSYDDDSPTPPPPTCPPLCPENEEYYNCEGGCVPRRCSELGYPLDCNKTCTPGCFCVGGYLRRDDGKCVPTNDCPSCGGDHNAQQGCGGNCNKMCSDYGQPPRSCPPACRFNACDCRPGFWYDITKEKCVKAVECPCTCTTTCPKNEVYNNCTGGCTVKRCSELGFPLDCKKCSPGCICKEGYLRRDDGKCVLTNDCPSCGGDHNAQQGCGTYCGGTCADIGKPPPKSCPIYCAPNGCACRPGFWYDRNAKKCVKAGECTPLCKENEEYSPCSNGGCGPKNCSQINDPRICVDPRICIKGCVCRDGYLRTDNGTCVPKNECPLLPPICPKNEIYNNCSGGCVPRKCSEIGFPLGCHQGEKCTPGCVCKDGNVRRDDGKCVPIPDCPSCGDDDNAQQGCGTYCGGTCADIGKPPPKSCPIYCAPNGCECRPGFWYDINTKKCVKAGECTPLCKENEEYSPCSNGGCGPKNCSQINDPRICVDPRICIKGCVCRDGYLRTDNGTCVPKNECPLLPPICPKNEIYNNCSGGCVPRKCSEIGFPLGCHQGEKCTPGCVCKDGNVRRDDGKCVPIPDCPSCGDDDNAQQGCGTHCGRTCADIGKPPPTACPHFCLPNGCECRPGFWYDISKKKCVKAGQCTPTCTKPNEIYDVCPAPCPGYRCDIDPRVIRCAAPPKPGDPLCVPGCRCKDDYARNATGTCVPRDQCEQTIPCGPNQHYNPCPGDCPPQVCGIDPNKVRCLIANPEYGDQRCRPGCECDDGYVRNEDNECIRREDCPPDCPANEEYSSCTNGGCSARNCSQYGKPVPCVKIDPKYCIKGCICVEGYLRNSKGICVPKDQCKPKCNKPNEVFDSCSRQCPPRMCNVNNALIKCKAPPKPGDPDCIAECRCIDDYYRNATGTCVPKKQCEKPIPCGKNQHYNACPMTCPPQECGVNPALILCLANPEYGDPRCRPGCVCDDGYLRDDSKECVPKDKCPPECPVNEQYSTCTNGGCDARNCSQLGKPVPCIRLDPRYCIKGCVCVKGYLRNSKGICVPKGECKPKCDKPNEVFDYCSPPCPPRRCNVKNALIKCAAPPKPGDPDCKAECRCIDTYYRNATGTCVPKKQCEKPIPCGPNQHYNPCPGDCPPQVCGIDPDKVRCLIANPEYGDPRCRPGCECDDGYVRNEDNKCIRRKDCPPDCPANEIYSSCTNGGCSTRNCSQYGKPVIDPKYCIKGCICVEGYLRNSKGICVPKDQCKPPDCPANEIYSSCTNGGCSARNCSQYGKPVPCVKMDPKYCIKGCICVEGYLRNSKGICVTKDQCKHCPANEIYSSCTNGGCSARNCSQYGKPVPCAKIDPKYCIKGCICVEGYLRNSKGICVPKDQCKPPVCPANEKYSSCINGGCSARNCSQYGKPVPCVKIDPKYCIKGCICVEGYLRNSKGICVPKDQCKHCPANEIYSSCTNGGCSARNCSQYGKPVPCVKIDPKYCIKGCICVEGYLRNSKGICVPKDQCKHCPANEKFSSCINGGCSARNCSQYGKPVPCVKINPKYCIKGCICVEGYLRNSKGICVPKDQCKLFDSCSRQCPPRMCNVNNALIKCKAPPKPGDPDCIAECRCIDDYYRNAKGTCVPKNQCEKPCPPKCGRNEVYNNCSNIYNYRPTKCSELGYPLKDQKCKVGCACKDGYVRDDKGICIPIKNCPSCGGDKNAESGCGNNCGRTCATYNKKQFFCTLACKLNGCDCKKGYVYDPNQKRCVDPKDCTPICEKDEEYSPCANGGCGPKNCSQINDPKICVHPRICVKGCVCKQGYLRAENGTCVPKDKCPPKCRENEHYESCITTCGSQNCSDAGKAWNCPNLPKGKCFSSGCVCNYGYLRNASNVCIRQEKCPTPSCPPGQVWDWCPTVKCEGDYCMKNRDSPRSCPTGIVCSPPRCVCGYNSKIDRRTGKCIPIPKCPPFKCGCNEQYQACPKNCPGESNCAPECKCIKGFLRDENKNCIPACKCPVTAPAQNS